jgi:hypothetical protein
MIQDHDAEKNHLFFELYPQLNIAPGPLAVDQVAQIKALIGRYVQYHVDRTYLLTALETYIIWSMTQHLTPSGRLNSKLKWNALRAMTDPLNGMPGYKAWDDYVIAQAKILRFDSDTAGMSIALPLWLGPDDAYGYQTALTQDTGFSALAQKFTRLPILDELAASDLFYNPTYYNDAGTPTKRANTDFMPNSANSYGMIAEYIFAQVRALITAFVAEYRSDMLVINNDLVRFYDMKCGMLDYRFNISEFSQQVRSMGPVDGEEYMSKYMTLFNDRPQAVVRNFDGVTRQVGDLVIPHTLRYPKFQSDGITVDPSQHHFDLTDEESRFLSWWR